MASAWAVQSERAGRTWNRAVRLVAAALCLGLATVAGAEPLPAGAGGGMVAASVAPAVPVGVQVLERGGNAVDAAIATGLAIGCAHQFSSGVGGGGFALVWDASARRAYALDARETAPAATVRWPIMDLVELTASFPACPPNTLRIARVSIRSLATVEVPWALT